MMLDFSNASIMSVTQNSEFLGDSLVRYRTIQSFNIQGFVQALNNQVGIAPVWSGISGMIKEAEDYSEITIRGINFGSGKILSFNFDNGTDFDVQTKPYTAQIQVYSTGDLTSVLSGYYSGLNYDLYHCIQNFSEDFNYSNNEGKHNYTHSVNLQLSSGNGNPITLAKIIALNLFNNKNLSGFIGQYSNLGQKKYYTETYNQISNECSWQETVEYSQNSGFYSWEATQNFNINENGITEITEQGNVKGLIEPLYESALSGMNEQKPLIYPRLTGLFYTYYNTDSYQLFNKPITQGYNVNKFDGTIGYNINYSNDPKYTGNFSWEYTNSLNRDSDGIYTVLEDGKIEGLGTKGLNRFSNALSGYNSISGQIDLRCGLFYSGNLNTTGTLKLISKTNDRNQYDGIINYNQTYTDDESLGTGVFRKVEIDINDNLPTYLKNSFNILGEQTMVQLTNNLSTLAERDVSVQIMGARNTALNKYLEETVSRLQPYKTYYNDSYLTNVNYNFNPNKNTFSFSCKINGVTGNIVENTDI